MTKLRLSLPLAFFSIIWSVLAILRFVLCAQCDNPETVLKVNSKRALISASCRACGHVFQPDQRHKLTTFIVKVSGRKSAKLS